MFSTLMAAISGNAALGWVVRRIFDWGGWVLTFFGMVLAAFMQLDPTTQAILVTALQGNWHDVSLGAVIGLVPLVISQWRSWRATVNDHTVVRNTRAPVGGLTEAQARDAVERATGRRPTGPIENRSRGI